VANNGVDFVTPALVFTYRSMPTISSISPSSMLFNTPITVTVTGTGFVSASTWFKFDVTVVAAATVPSSSSATVSAPAHASGLVDLEVSTDGQIYSTQKTQFEYFPTTTITSVLPTLGPTTGGTIVTVFANHLIPGPLLACNFVYGIVQGTWLSSTSMQCSSPAGAQTTQLLTVSNNRVQYSVSTSYIYYTPPVPTSLSATQGPISAFCRRSVYPGPV
jgi:hypothetical protein